MLTKYFTRQHTLDQREFINPAVASYRMALQDYYLPVSQPENYRLRRALRIAFVLP
jgi:hypothetical protein